jgi:hypothetical protein
MANVELANMVTEQYYSCCGKSICRGCWYEFRVGCMEAQSGNMERAMRHWRIAASAGYYDAKQKLLIEFNKGLVNQDEMDSILTAYNNSCIEMRSEAREYTD